MTTAVRSALSFIMSEHRCHRHIQMIRTTGGCFLNSRQKHPPQRLWIPSLFKSFLKGNLCASPTTMCICIMIKGLLKDLIRTEFLHLDSFQLLAFEGFSNMQRRSRTAEFNFQSIFIVFVAQTQILNNKYNDELDQMNLWPDMYNICYNHEPISEWHIQVYWRLRPYSVTNSLCVKTMQGAALVEVCLMYQ